MSSRGRGFGFSLIEILVVVVIIGIVASVALMSLGLLGDDRELQTEARRVVSLVEVARDEALMQGRDFGIEVMAQGYRFVEYDPFSNQWAELIADDIFRMRQLPEDAEFDLLLDDQRIELQSNPRAFEDDDDDMRSGLIESYAPHILIFSSGDMTPFELRILRPQADQAVAIRTDLAGAIEFVTEDD